MWPHGNSNIFFFFFIQIWLDSWKFSQIRIWISAIWTWAIGPRMRVRTSAALQSKIAKSVSMRVLWFWWVGPLKSPMYVRSSKVLVTYAPRSIFHVQFAMYDFHMQSKSVFCRRRSWRHRGFQPTMTLIKRRKDAAIDIYIHDMDRLAGEDLEQSAKKRGEPNAPLSQYVAPQVRCVLYTLLLLLLFRWLLLLQLSSLDIIHVAFPVGHVSYMSVYAGLVSV